MRRRDSNKGTRGPPLALRLASNRHVWTWNSACANWRWMKGTPPEEAERIQVWSYLDDFVFLTPLEMVVHIPRVVRECLGPFGVCD